MTDSISHELPTSEDLKASEIIDLENLAPANDTTSPELEVDDETKLEVLMNKRRTGTYTVHGYSFRKLKALNAFLQNKAEYTGSQEGYYLAVASNGVVQMLNAEHVKAAEAETVRSYEFRPQLLELINFFVNKINGKGASSIGSILETVLPISNALAEVRKNDDTIIDLAYRTDRNIGAFLTEHGLQQKAAEYYKKVSQPVNS